MNIFILDLDPAVCARYHVNSHVSKMILESAQLLCTAILHHGGEAQYKQAHKNHPCAIWARETRANFNWLVDLGLELAKEFEFRYQNKHKSAEVIKDCSAKASFIPDGELTVFAQAMPDEYKNPDAVIAYRAYYNGAKRKLAKWQPREQPFWWVEDVGQS